MTALFGTAFSGWTLWLRYEQRSLIVGLRHRQLFVHNLPVSATVPYSISGKINSTWFVFTQTPTFWFLLIDNSYAESVILGHGPNRKQYRHCTCMCVSMRPCLGITLPLIKYSQENTVGTGTLQCTGTLQKFGGSGFKPLARYTLNAANKPPLPLWCTTDSPLGQEVGGKCAVEHESAVWKALSGWSPYDCWKSIGFFPYTFISDVPVKFGLNIQSHAN